MVKIKQPKNLQERIFADVRELGMSVGEKVNLVKGAFGKRHVCHLTREQGLLLKSFLEYCLANEVAPTPENFESFPTPATVVK